METLLEMQNIKKAFGSFVANEDVSLTLMKGEVHSLLGENGAGKTTLMNILYGLYKPTAGKLILEGRTLQVKDPKHMLNQGIAMVHQHFMLVPTLSVAENVVLGNLRPFRPNLEEVAKKITQLAKELGFEIDPKEKVGNLTVGVQQRVEIIKALYRDVKILILDEPTAVLTPGETGEFLEMLRNLANKGIGVFFISHKFDEVLTVSDRISVMRRGKKVATLKKEAFNHEELARLMTGREVVFSAQRNDYTGEEQNRVQLEKVCTNTRNEKQNLKNISFTIPAGQVLAIAGVDGNGQEELLHVLMGMLKPSEGDVFLGEGKSVHNSPKQVLSQEVGFIPSDRHLEGLVLGMDIEENLLLECFLQQPFSKWGLFNKKQVEQFGNEMIEKYDIRTKDSKQLVRNLSGGNQQKVVLARAMQKNPKIIFAAYPTRGLDVGAIESIHKFLNEQREKGCGIVLVSNELDEVFALGDSIGVMYEGVLMGPYPKESITHEDVGMMMAGKQLED